MKKRIGHKVLQNRKYRHEFAGKSLIRAAFCLISAFSVSSMAMAQIGPAVTQAEMDALAPDGFTVNLEDHPLDIAEASDFDFMGLSPVLKDTVVELPDESAGSRLFNLDFADVSCFAGERACLTESDQLDVRYNTSFATPIYKGLDIELSPRASVSFDDESSSALVGALVKIGDDLKDTSDFKTNTWYMFAGADAEAVTYSANSSRRLTNGEFYLQDKIIVGDAQAGVGYRIGDADVSLGYFRREVTSFGREIDSGNISYTEDAAALSFTWRR